MPADLNLLMYNTEDECWELCTNIKLDDFDAAEDNTDLDASAAAHGLFAKADKIKLDAIAAGAQVGNCSIVTGDYTGDDSTDQSVDTGISGQVKFVRIWKYRTSAAAQVIFELSDTMYANLSQWHATTSWNTALNQIIALDADGKFHVDDAGSNQHPNKNTQVYHYVALIG